MPLHRLLAAALALLAATPALAQTPFPCRIGPFAKDGHLIAEALDAVGQAGRVEYRLRVRNPHPWPAAVLPVVEAPGIAAALAEPVVVPPRGARLVPVGSWPDGPRATGPAPSAAAVRAALTMPFCVVPAPASGHPAILPRGVEVVRDEGAHQILQRF